jgi:hypothetical protein
MEPKHSKLQSDIRQEFIQGFQGLPCSVLPVTRGKKIQDILKLRPDSQQAWLIKRQNGNASGQLSSFNSWNRDVSLHMVLPA